MTTTTAHLAQAASRPRVRQSNPALSRVLKYVVARAVVLFLTLVAGVYIAVIIANLGGYMDEIVRDRIDQALMGMSMGMRGASLEEKVAFIEEARTAMEEAAGLYDPFLLRCLRWMPDTLTLKVGERTGVQENLPNTLLLFGAASLLLFLLSLTLAPLLARKYGSWLDRIVVSVSPISSAPSWALGIILVVIFAAELHLLPFNGKFDAYPPATKAGYVLVVLKHMVLPVAAIVLSMLFQIVYAWRTFFLIHASEDYVEVATAKGLPTGMLQKRYILRPALPFLLTSFTLTLLSFWQAAIALEYFFSWPGIGTLYIESIRVRWYSPSTAIGILVIFAYALVLTVFLLDVIYALVDPRVKVGGDGRSGEVVQRKKSRRGRRRPKSRALERKQHPQLQPHSFDASRSRVAAPYQSPRTRRLRPLGTTVRQMVSGLGRTLSDIAVYPSAIGALAFITALVIASITTVIALPYSEVVQLWRDEDAWYRNPEHAQPAWTNLFRKQDLPETIVLDSRDGTAAKSSSTSGKGMTEITLSFLFDYPYSGLPQDLVVRLDAQYDEKKPLISMTWITPDGREIDMGSTTIVAHHKYVASQDSRLRRKLDGRYPIAGLFAEPSSTLKARGEATIESDRSRAPAAPGFYELRVEGLVFEENSDLDGELILFGQVHGLAGTDNYHRDLMVALLWGMPVALVLGLVGAVCSSLATMAVAGIGAWFGGWVDGVVQRITEVNVILPTLPVGIMVYFLYSKSVWVVVGMVIVLSIFGNAVKNYRSAFLQFREAPYIEAARAYGAGDWRIVFRYLTPRIVPLLIPQLVIMIPGFVFLEATLAILGVSDPVLPTWGKLVHEALRNGAFQGYYYWILEPLALLMGTGLAFALLGLALDRIFNPRLRTM